MKEPDPDPQPPVDFGEDEQVSRSFRAAVRAALDNHARKGNRVAVWRNGRQWVRDGRHVHRDAVAARYRATLQRVLGG